MNGRTPECPAPSGAGHSTYERVWTAWGGESGVEAEYHHIGEPVLPASG
ncbi:hypothetical protein [Streptomyces sp. NPDC014623]